VPDRRVRTRSARCRAGRRSHQRGHIAVRDDRADRRCPSRHHSPGRFVVSGHNPTDVQRHKIIGLCNRLAPAPGFYSILPAKKSQSFVKQRYKYRALRVRPAEPVGWAITEK
jgi:hypothetical protein